MFELPGNSVTNGCIIAFGLALLYPGVRMKFLYSLTSIFRARARGRGRGTQQRADFPLKFMPLSLIGCF
jgi:hypothetical protein